MSVVVSVQDVGPWRKQLTVEVPAPDVEAETRNVVRDLGRQVRIPGFRRGKVPADLVRRRFAKDIEREVIDRLVPRFWRQAETEKSIDPLLPPEFQEVGELTAGAPLTFIATVETRPHIELRNLSDFALPDLQIEPGELDVDKALDDLRARFGNWVPVDRAAARGDQVKAEITEIMPSVGGAGAPNQVAGGAGAPDQVAGGASAPDQAAGGASAPDQVPGGAGAPGEPAAGAEPAAPEAAAAAGQPAAVPHVHTENVDFEVGDERVWEELSLAVSGLSAGQEIPFWREAQELAAGAPDGEATRTRRRRFNVKVAAVKERVLPALDDELAARVNPSLGGLTALRELVVERLREARAEERGEMRRRALLQQLRERHPLELPQGVVQREIESLAREYAESLARRGVRPEQAGVDWQQLRTDLQPVAESRVHDRLLLDAIADSDDDPVVVTDDEFERTLAVLARAQKTTTPALRRALEQDHRLASLRNQMRRDKTVRHLLGEPVPNIAEVAESVVPPDALEAHGHAG
jgi:FKBP-type peptidyl-prolyl cis-trans isomerase (trigger factor)